MGPELTIGESIRQARKERGLSREAVSRETRLSMVILSNLETDHFAELPGGLYVENAIRILADYLELDRAALMARYRDGRGEKTTESAGSVEPALWTEAGVPETRVQGWRPGRRLLVIAASVLLLVLLGLAQIMGWLKLPEFGGGDGDAELEQVQASVAEEGTTTPLPPIDDPVGIEQEQDSLETQPTIAAEAVRWNDGPLLPTGAAREAILRREAAMELLITASSDCRVQVNMDGRRHLVRQMITGNAWRLRAADHLVISVDDGAALLLELDGEPYPLPEHLPRGESLALRIDVDR